MVGAASRSRIVSAARAAATATPAQTCSPVWKAWMFASGWPATVRTGWRAEMTAVSRPPRSPRRSSAGR